MCCASRRTSALISVAPQGVRPGPAEPMWSAMTKLSWRTAVRPEAREHWECLLRPPASRWALPAVLCRENQFAAHERRALPSRVAAIGGSASLAACVTTNRKSA